MFKALIFPPTVKECIRTCAEVNSTQCSNQQANESPSLTMTSWAHCNGRQWMVEQHCQPMQQRVRGRTRRRKYQMWWRPTVPDPVSPPSASHFHAHITSYAQFSTSVCGFLWRHLHLPVVRHPCSHCYRNTRVLFRSYHTAVFISARISRASVTARGIVEGSCQTRTWYRVDMKTAMW